MTEASGAIVKRAHQPDVGLQLPCQPVVHSAESIHPARETREIRSNIGDLVLKLAEHPGKHLVGGHRLAASSLARTPRVIRAVTLSGLPPTRTTGADPGCQPSARSMRSSVRTVGVFCTSRSRTLASVLGLGKPRRAASCLLICSCSSRAAKKCVSRRTPLVGNVIARTLSHGVREVGSAFGVSISVICGG